MDCESLGAAAYVGLTHPSHHITRTVSSSSYVGTYGLAVGLYLFWTGGWVESAEAYLFVCLSQVIKSSISVLAHWV